MEQEARTRIIGIVNLTPDSFSDGGALSGVDAVLTHIQSLLDAGAEVIDLGAESTRPSATPLDHAEEWKRLGAVLKAARDRFPVATLSVDTRHAATAEAALRAGADWINDVTAGADPNMWKVVAARRHCRYVFMHSLSVPAEPLHTLPDGLDVVTFMQSWAREKIAAICRAGIESEQLIFDPGIGFGKTAAQSWDLVRRAEELMQDIASPTLFGHSRKSFMKSLTGDKPATERDMETHMLSAHLSAAGAHYLRVHDVAGTRRAMAMARALSHGI